MKSKSFEENRGTMSKKTVLMVKSITKFSRERVRKFKNLCTQGMDNEYTWNN